MTNIDYIIYRYMSNKKNASCEAKDKYKRQLEIPQPLVEEGGKEIK